MDLLRCYTNDEPKEEPEPREMPHPKKVFGIPRRTRFNLDKTTTKAKKVLKNPYDSEEERRFVL
jgi:hypothetical protein